MTTQRPFRFGAGQFIEPTRRAWTERARQIESLGYDTLLTADHFGQGFAPMLGLHAAAMATTTLRVGCTVFGNDFRHPAIFANEAATLDVLADGRTEFGIGAGWVKREYDAAGIPFDSPGTRVDRMIEAVSVIKRLWRGETVEHEGGHYEIHGLSDPVRPVQQPHPPVFIGGGGKRLLSFAACEADIIGVIAKAKPAGGMDFGGDETDEAFARKIGWIREAAGARFDRIELAMLLWHVRITDHRDAVADEIASHRGLTRDQVLASPCYSIGSVDHVVEQLESLRERFGLSYFSVFPRDVDAFAPVVARLHGR